MVNNPEAKTEGPKTSGLNVSNLSERRSDTVSKAVQLSNFKPYEAPRRKAGLRDDQVSISKHSIAVPKSVADKLGPQVAMLFSDTDNAIAIQKSPNGDYKLKQVGKLKSTRSVYCKGLIEAKKIGKGRYSTQFDEKTGMLVVSIGNRTAPAQKPVKK